ncbi:MAG: Response regulator of zinc sigma-54-dependent two-component system, partial [Labilithrix sp.]|nr:Response regulator of zinc sigma-54-dependent two-component system [Labilithrix sp.]
MIRLEVTRGQLSGTAIEPTSDVVRIGRAEGNDLVVPDTHVSSEHAKIVFSGDRYVLVDQRSTNGTAILRGADRIALDDSNSRESSLEDGDVIELGSQDRIVHVAVGLREEADDARVFAMKKIEELVPRATILEKDEGRLRILYEALKRIGGSQDLSEVLVAICESSFTLVPLATHVTIILRDDDDESVASKGVSGYVPVMTRVRGQDAPPSQAIPITRSVFRKVVSERAAVVAADAPRDVGQSESLMGAQIRSTLGIPLWKGEEILG